MDGADAIKYILQNEIDGAIVECGVEHLWINELMNNQKILLLYCTRFKSLMLYNTKNRALL